MRFTLRSRFQRSSEVSARVGWPDSEQLMPAALTAPSSRPPHLTVSAIQLSTCVESDTSTFWKRTRASFTAVWKCSSALESLASSKSPTDTLAPLESKRSTVENPIPCAPPLTANILPSMLLMREWRGLMGQIRGLCFQHRTPHRTSSLERGEY